MREHSGTVVWILAGIVFVIILVVANIFAEEQRTEQYHQCMFLVKRMIPDADPIDRNEICRLISK